MDSSHIYISHASKDDEFVEELRTALESQRLPVWVDSRNLRGGAKLAPEISKAIKQARQTIVVLSPNTINSPWVRKEIQQALAVEKRRGKEGYRVIPLLLPGVEPSALALWFDDDPVGAKIELKAGGVSEALPQILAALGERLLDYQPQQTTPEKPVEELLVILSDPKVETIDGKRRASAEARLIYEPADAVWPNVESKRFVFTAPLGPIEADDLRWYLEEFFRWPVGVFKERADGIAARLPEWGKLLFDEVAKTDSAKAALNAWRNPVDSAELRFSVMVDSELLDGASEEDQAAANEAANILLSLPWELLQDERGFLFHGKNPARVRRRLPNRNPQKSVTRELPIRILLVSPRPEEKFATYFDHRISAKPLAEAVEALGEMAKLAILSPPTFNALQAELARAADAGQPYDVVHFDGHGVYDRKVGLGGLCFEDPKDVDKLEDRAMEMVYAKELAEVMGYHRIPLVFLEACQSAQMEGTPSASVAPSLLNEGVTSVVAMSHTVLLETAHRFVRAFYGELARGARIGSAMLAGQRALQTDTYRGRVMGAGELHLQDWFVPVLYQEAQDPQLVTRLPVEQSRQLLETQRRLSLGRLPSPPPHTFIGRSRELLKLERLLMKEGPAELCYAVVRGMGGQGKSTLAVEAARWLVRTGRFRRAAFVSLEHYADERGMLDSLGEQLVAEGYNWSAAHFPYLKQALQHVERALRDHPTIIVLDNLESVRPRINTASGNNSVDELFAICQSLLQADKRTRLLFTTREPLPEPFNHRHREITLGALSREDAIELVGDVMRGEGLTPKHDDAGNTPQEIIELVEAVNRHAHTLTLMAREISRSVVRATTSDLRRLMAELDAKHPSDPENSLYASVELSLRRLPSEARSQIQVLGLFFGGAHLAVLEHMLGADEEIVRGLASALIEVGLSEDAGYGHLRLHPALAPYLLTNMSVAERKASMERWAEGMTLLAYTLYEQEFNDPLLAHRLTLLELPNLLELLDWKLNNAKPDEVVDLTICLESSLSRLGRPQALANVILAREQAARRLMTEWNHAHYLAATAVIDRFLDRDDYQAARAAAEQLLKTCLAQQEHAYPGAGFDTAMAFFRLARVLRSGGDAAQALGVLNEASIRFEGLIEAPPAGASFIERMRAAIITERGDCLRDLGRLEEAAAYQESIERFRRMEDDRSVAVCLGQLATIRKLQASRLEPIARSQVIAVAQMPYVQVQPRSIHTRQSLAGSLFIDDGGYMEAARLYSEAQGIFEALGEPLSVATAWHQIGMLHKEIGQPAQAENALRQALAISVQQVDRGGEASSLHELGSLYDEMGRLEEAVSFYMQAADIFTRQLNPFCEGAVRSNLAYTLIKLYRFDEARRELRRAIECREVAGEAGESWKTWSILQILEEASGDPQSTKLARQNATDSYRAYRRAGGESQAPGSQLIALTTQAIEQKSAIEAEQELTQISQTSTAPWAKALIPKLQSILRGEPSKALFDDSDLNYRDAVELQLMLEHMASLQDKK